MLAHKFREAIESDDAPSRRESRLQNVPCVEPSAVGLDTFPEAGTRKRVRANKSRGPLRRRLRKLSERDEPPTTLVSPSERGNAVTVDVQAHIVVFRELEVGARVAPRQQKVAGIGAGEGSQEGSQCSGSGWQCPFPVHLDRAHCLKHIQQKRFGGKMRNEAAVGKTPEGTKATTTSCLKQGRAAAGNDFILDGSEWITRLDSQRQRGQPEGRKFCSQRRERWSIRQGKRVRFRIPLVEGGPEVVVELGKDAEEGLGSEDQKVPVLVDVEALDERAVGWQTASLGGQQFGAAVDGVRVRQSARLARHRRSTAQELLGITPRKVQNGGGYGCVKRRKVAGARDEPALPISAPSAQICKLQYSAEVVCISDSSSDCPPLPGINCVIGEWSEAEQEKSEQDGATWKRIRLDGSAFYDDLLRAAGGAAAFQDCEWGGVLRCRWIGKMEEALLEVMPSQVARGSHDQVQVAEGPYSWHSHAILGDSWPNLPSTADLLGVARESNLRPGGRGHVHLVVTPIGTWLLQASEKLVQTLYDGSTRSAAEGALEIQLQQIFDAHKCSVGYLPGVVPVDAPDFWMDGHEAAIRDALTKGDVEAQVRAYAEQLEKDADFVVGFVGHGATDACFPLHCEPATRRRKRRTPLLEN